MYTEEQKLNPTRNDKEWMNVSMPESLIDSLTD